MLFHTKRWSVYDIPFLTHGAACSPVQPSGQQVASCDGPYFGINNFILDQGNAPWDDLMAIAVTRFDDADPALGVDTWQVDGAQPGWPLAHMRHFAARQNGVYLLDFPASLTPADVSVDISNMHDASDAFVLGIRFSGDEEAQVYSSTYTYQGPYAGYLSDGHATAPPSAIKHDYVAVEDLQVVIDSGGETYWQDHDNNVVWMKITLNGLVQLAVPSGLDAEEFSDVNLYNAFHLRVW